MDYRELLFLRAARETGVLDAVVTDADTVAAVADETGVTERAARIGVETLCDLGFLHRTDDGFEPTNRMLGFLSKTDLRSIGSLPHELDTLDDWIALPETMQTGDRPVPSPDATRNRLGAMAALDEGDVRAAVTAAVHEHPDAATVLDAYGGSGTFSREFARRGYDVTLADTQDVVEVDEPLLEHEPVSLQATDPLDGVEGTYDLVFCANTARTLSPDDNERLLDALYDAVPPGGTVVHVDRLRDHAENPGLLAAEMLARTDGGNAYAEADFGEWFAAAGFERPRVSDVPGTRSQAVAADRPAND
ncbi:methyltransferase domain-containing protein [Salarchaeum japonicum]|uniref:Methyltransferase domain-containing protein n=1 Tax=Salarchaeum japonicum TaxID=555573 RepID=A0AAV3T1A2_9EURY|nr:methyltransferase domain-containing protein [Salarchaeum japonicum]